MKEMFSRLPYDELVTLEFVTQAKKETKPKRKYTKKKKEAEKPKEEPIEYINVEGVDLEKIKIEENRD